MDIDNHCKFMYGSKASAVMGSRGDASSWKCRKAGGLVPVNMSRLCELDYGKGFRAVNADPGDAYTWSCVGG
jgi:hypothetical protein